MNLAGAAGAIQAMPYQRTSVPTKSNSRGVDGVGRRYDRIPGNRVRRRVPKNPHIAIAVARTGESYQFQNSAGNVSCNLGSRANSAAVAMPLA
jgi:hypothetical protein